MIVIHLKENGLSPRKAPWHYKYSIYTVAIAILMDPNKVLYNLFCIILSIRFSLEVDFFSSDNIILIFNQSNVNITINTKIDPITSLHISNQTK